MQIKTILNRVSRFKSHVYGKVRWLDHDDGRLALEVELEPRSNGRPVCSGCDEIRPGYDQAAVARRFEFVPIWGIAVYFLYRMRRVDCPKSTGLS